MSDEQKLDLRLHSSIAKIIVGESPLHAQYAVLHPEAKGDTDSTDFGSIAHELLLGGSDRIGIVDFSQYRTKKGDVAKDYRCQEAADARDAIRAAGKIPITVEDFSRVEQLVLKVSDFLLANDLALTGQSEMKLEWTEDGVECAGRLDHFIEDRGLIIDLKFVRSANPAKLPGVFAQFGYDIQYSAYTSGVEQKFPNLRGRTDFVFVFAEPDPPFAITAARLAGTMKALGNSRWGRAVSTWRECIEIYGWDKPWPGFLPEGEFERVVAPPWLLASEGEKNQEFADKMEAGL